MPWTLAKHLPGPGLPFSWRLSEEHEQFSGEPLGTTSTQISLDINVSFQSLLNPTDLSGVLTMGQRLWITRGTIPSS